MASASKGFRNLDKQQKPENFKRTFGNNRKPNSAANNPYKKKENKNSESYVQAGIVKNTYNNKPSFKGKKPMKVEQHTHVQVSKDIDVSKYFTINTSMVGGNNDYNVTLETALKEVKLLDKAIKRLNFKGKKLSYQDKTSMLVSLKDLTKRKKAILFRIATVNVLNTITVNITGKDIIMPLFLARVYLKETQELINKLSTAKYSYGPYDNKTKKNAFNTDMEVEALERAVLDINTELAAAAKKITLDIPR